MLKPGEGRDRQESVHPHTEAWCVNDQHGGSVRQHELLAQEGGPGVHWVMVDNMPLVQMQDWHVAGKHTYAAMAEWEIIYTTV